VCKGTINNPNRLEIGSRIKEIILFKAKMMAVSKEITTFAHYKIKKRF
jgi:hypothetical protein